MEEFKRGLSQAKSVIQDSLTNMDVKDAEGSHA